MPIFFLPICCFNKTVNSLFHCCNLLTLSVTALQCYSSKNDSAKVRIYLYIYIYINIYINIEVFLGYGIPFREL